MIAISKNVLGMVRTDFFNILQIRNVKKIITLIKCNYTMKYD